MVTELNKSSEEGNSVPLHGGAIQRTLEGLLPLIRHVLEPGVPGSVSVVPLDGFAVSFYRRRKPRRESSTNLPKLVSGILRGFIIGDRHFLAINRRGFGTFGLREDGLWVIRNPLRVLWVPDHAGCMVRIPRIALRPTAAADPLSLRQALHDILSAILWDRLRDQAERFEGTYMLPRSASPHSQT